MSYQYESLSDDEARSLSDRRHEPAIEKRYLLSVVKFIQSRVRNVPHQDQDDRFQDGMLGALEAVRSWKPELSSWFSHAARTIRRAIQRSIWRYEAAIRGVSYATYFANVQGVYNTTLPEPVVELKPASDDHPGDEPAVSYEFSDSDTKLVGQLCELSPFYNRTPRMSEYVNRVVLGDETMAGFAASKGLTYQAIQSQWNTFRKEMKARCQGVST